MIVLIFYLTVWLGVSTQSATNVLFTGIKELRLYLNSEDGIFKLAFFYK